MRVMCPECGEEWGIELTGIQGRQNWDLPGVATAGDPNHTCDDPNCDGIHPLVCGQGMKKRV